jgi:hypothetical protein
MILNPGAGKNIFQVARLGTRGSPRRQPAVADRIWAEAEESLFRAKPALQPKNS